MSVVTKVFIFASAAFWALATEQMRRRRRAASVFVILILVDFYHGGPWGGAVLVEGFYRKVIGFFFVHNLEPIIIDVTKLDTIVQFIRSRTEIDVIAKSVV